MAQLSVTFDFPESLLSHDVKALIVYKAYRGDFCPYVLDGSIDEQLLLLLMERMYMRLPGTINERR